MPRLVSVVIPTRGNSRGLPAQVAAINAQHSDVEIVIAVNGDTEPFMADFATWASRLRQCCKVVDASAQVGPSFARNVGWRESRGDVVLFCDDDDIVRDGWVNALLAAISKYDIVGGRLAYDGVNNPDDGVLWRHDWTTGLPRSKNHLRFAPSANVAIRREVLSRLDGFCEQLGTGEDTDLCWRAQYAGFSIGYEPTAVVDYRMRQGAMQQFKQAYSYGLYDRQLISRHAKMGVKQCALSTIMVGVFKATRSLLLGVCSRRYRMLSAALTGHTLGICMSSLPSMLGSQELRK